MNKFNQNIVITALVLLFASCINNTDSVINEPVIADEILIDSIWAANGVRFDLKTVNDMQFVAYFDRNRMMTVASRRIGSKHWTKKTLDNQLIWDSHNSVVLGVDEVGYIHVSGNMHAQPLVYFRSSKPYDVTTMEPIHKMTEHQEQRYTYPGFFNTKNGNLFYSYRIGGSGDGDIFVNRFLSDTKEWVRLYDTSLFEGREEHESRSAYHHKLKDSEGNYHFVWMWRWTPMVETCHNLCYAKTEDLEHWVNAAGDTVNIPLKPEDDKLFVDPVPSKGGLHNSRFKTILTQKNEPIIGYTKYDEQGLTQLYLARFTNGAWKIKQISDWNFRWEFKEGGAFMTEGGVFNFAGISENGVLAIDWSTEKGDKGRYNIDTETLEHVDKKVKLEKKYPDNLMDNITNISGMSVRIVRDKAGTLKDGSTFYLKYEARHGGFRRHQPEVIPAGPLSPLKLVHVQIP